MPSYNYTCKDCDSVQVDFRSMADRQKPMKCCMCGGKALHSISFPSIQTMTKDERWVRDHEVNGNGVISNA